MNKFRPYLCQMVLCACECVRLYVSMRNLLQETIYLHIASVAYFVAKHRRTNNLLVIYLGPPLIILGFLSDRIIYLICPELFFIRITRTDASSISNIDLFMFSSQFII